MSETTKKIKELDQQTCYVVVGEDRGMGANVEAVYAYKVEADKHAASSSHLYVEESIFYSPSTQSTHDELASNWCETIC